MFGLLLVQPICLSYATISAVCDLGHVGNLGLRLA